VPAAWAKASDQTAYVELNFAFKAGDDAQEKLNTFYELEDLPQTLRRSVTHAIWQALQADLRRIAIVEAEQLRSSLGPDVNSPSATQAMIAAWTHTFRTTCDFRSETDALRDGDGGFGYDAADDEEEAAAARRQSTGSAAGASTATPAPSTGGNSTSGATTTTAAVQSSAAAGTPPTVDFDVAFAAVMAAGGDYVNSIFHVERENALALGKAFKRMEDKLQELQQRQSEEMDLVLKDTDSAPAQRPASPVPAPATSADADDDTAPRSVYDHQTPTDRISQLVNRHVADSSALEESWRAKLSELKKQQRTKYRQFLQSLYVNEVSQALPILQSGNAMTMIYAQQKLRPQKGRSVSTLAPRGAELDLITREMWMGSGQRKSSFVVRLSLGDVVDLCERDFSEKEFRQTRKTMQNLYSQALSAVLLPHASATWADIEGGVGASPRVKRFVRACERSTEYHFKTLASQVRHVKMAAESHLTAQVQPYSSQPAQAIRSAWGSSPFEDHNSFLLPGDVFLTKHSNLLAAHVCFHLMDAPWKFSESDNLAFELGKVRVRLLVVCCLLIAGGDASCLSPVLCHDRSSLTVLGSCCLSSQNPVLDGVRQAIITASRNGIYSLAIPVLFSESHRLSSLSLAQSTRMVTAGSSSGATSSLDQETSRLVEGLFRCVRTCMSELAADNESSLKEVYFMVPPPTQVKSLAAEQATSLDTPLIRQCKLAFNNVYQS